MQPSTIIGQAAASMNQGQPVMNQVSNTAPTFNPNNVVPQNSPMPQGSPMSPIAKALQRRGMQMPQQMQQPTAQPQPEPQVTLPIEDQNANQAGVQVPASEAELIIKALTKRMDTLGKHESAVRDHLFAPQGGMV